jgi:hypothetical protein
MRKHEAGKRNSLSLPMVCLGQEIFILREQNALQLSCSIKENVVGNLPAAVILRSQNINTSQT